MHTIKVQDDDQLIEALQQGPADRNDAAHVYVLFYAREVPATGVSWCPDCVKADPLVRQGIEKFPDSVLITYPFDRKTG
ncbi:hypothetical protein IWQ60_004020 [Tieghemiomyces parasiticus]|uniref:Thioredoxin domain-containing protein n=1 Tax=Tieghemiomyces parasiticus TaxID=78921 RepID=A0A9W8AGJ5_9FUNG|nr:hypothetical protein IWQ60_004020 [Tieghemiomyces parasiticus]